MSFIRRALQWRQITVIREKAAGSNKRCMACKSGTEMIVLMFVFLVGGKGFLFFSLERTLFLYHEVSHGDVLCLNSPFLVMSRDPAATSDIRICSSCWCVLAFPRNCEALCDDSESLMGLYTNFCQLDFRRNKR